MTNGIPRLYKTGIRLNGSILDVGSGNALWGHQLSQLGFTNVTCIDKFCENTPYNDVIFKQCEILDIEGNYDFRE
jgi:hypothetical protein